MIASLLQLVGLILVVTAVFLVHPVAGLAAAGAATFVVGLVLDRPVDR